MVIQFNKSIKGVSNYKKKGCLKNFLTTPAFQRVIKIRYLLLSGLGNNTFLESLILPDLSSTPINLTSII